MGDVPTGSLIPATKHCKVCAEEIKFAAPLRVHCKSYQDWRSLFGVSTTVLSRRRVACVGPLGRPAGCSGDDNPSEFRTDIHRARVYRRHYLCLSLASG